MIASDKLKHAGYSHVNVFHDMTNAFLCTPHSTLNANARNNCIARDAKLLQQRHEEASIVLECPDRKICFQLGEGGMVGDHGGPISFMTSFHPGIKEWDEKVASDNEHLLATIDPITKIEVDIGVTTYVDDIHAKHVINTIHKKTQEPFMRLQKANNALDNILDKAGYAQNRSKQESLPIFIGKHSKNNYRTFVKSCKSMGLGKVGMCARYLGAQLAAPGDYKSELTCRLNAITIGWCRLGSFWTTESSYKMKRLCFISNVQSAGLSAGHVIPYLKSQTDQIDSRLCKYLRVAMIGKAHTVETTFAAHPPLAHKYIHRSMSNEKVFKFWKIAPCSIEFRIRRIRMWQSFLRQPPPTRAGKCSNVWEAHI